MSKLTDGFEELAGYGIERGFYITDVVRLLAHTRKLEAMIVNHFEGGHIGGDSCIVCGQYSGHSPDCELARLISE